ncbi:MAG: Uma2 family endonuclease [Planctomycetaceae bacterium]|nr:Uma2 family endonuclease [Planctomycetaceae bacterium]
MASASQPLLTAEEFGRRADPGYPEELVRGRIVTMPPPGRRHGQVCVQVVYLLRRFLEGADRLAASRSCSCCSGELDGGLAPDLNDLTTLKFLAASLLAPPHEGLPFAVDLDTP